MQNKLIKIVKTLEELHDKMDRRFYVTGSMGLWMQGKMERLPKDLDIVMDESDWDACHYARLANTTYEYVNEDLDDTSTYQFKVNGVKVDVFTLMVDKYIEMEFFGKKYLVADASYSIDAKIKYTMSYLKNRKILEYAEQLKKHIDDLIYYFDQQSSPF